MKRKTKRFADGDVVKDIASEANDEAQTRANRGESAKSESYKAEPGQQSIGMKKETFGEAFARARRSGDKTFQFGGKSYGTALKGETKSASKVPPPTTIEAGTAAGLASTGRTRARPEDYEQDEYKTGRFENKMNRSLGRTTAPENAAKIEKYNEARKQAAADRAATAKQTQAAGTTDMATLRKSKMDASLPVDEQRIYSQFKKGGTVKSASSRADGCAVRGKTRGKMY